MFILSTPFYNLYSFHSFYIFYSFVAYLPSFTTLSMCLYYAYSTFKLNLILYIQNTNINDNIKIVGYQKYIHTLTRLHRHVI